MASQSNWRQNPLIINPLLGWLVGMLWWVGLLLSFAVANRSDRELAAPLIRAPLVALPWAFVWVAVGVANAQFRGFWVPIAATVGTVIGGIYVVATHPFDGWLCVFMMIGCLGGTLAGLVVGVLTRATWGWFQGWEDSL
jgi:hypothetical protein